MLPNPLSENEIYNTGYHDGVTDERERIAKAIEERLKEMHSDLSNPRYEEAVRIARNGGKE